MPPSKDPMVQTWEEFDARIIETLKSVQESPAVRAFMALGEYQTTDIRGDWTHGKKEMIEQFNDHPDIRLWKSVREYAKYRKDNPELQAILGEYNEDLVSEVKVD